MNTNEAIEAGYRFILATELTRRQSRNPSYSLRSFAKALGISATALSEALNGKRCLRRDSAQKIADRLAIPPEDRPKFILSAMGIENGEVSGMKPRELNAEAHRALDFDQ